MGALNTTRPTLMDVAQLLDKDGKIMPVVELLSQTNELLDDMVWIEANEVTAHKTTVRTGLPTPTWRKLYGGVQPSKAKNVPVRDTMGMLEAYAEVDKALADLNGNTTAFRMSEDAAFIEAMNQEMASTIFYGSESTAPEEFTGLAPRYNSVSAENARNIISSASSPDSNDNTSAWLIVWGPNTVHGIYPKGSMAGLQVTDKGVVTIESIDGNGGRMEAYRTHYRWDCGICVRDWRYAVRIRIDQEDMLATAATGPNLVNLFAQATHRIPNLSMGRPAFYVNRGLSEMLDLQALNKSTMAFQTIENAQGKFVTTFRGIPIRTCDALLNTEDYS